MRTTLRSRLGFWDVLGEGTPVPIDDRTALGTRRVTTPATGLVAAAPVTDDAVERTLTVVGEGDA